LKLKNVITESGLTQATAATALEVRINSQKKLGIQAFDPRVSMFADSNGDYLKALKEE